MRPNLPPWVLLCLGGALVYGVILGSWSGLTSALWMLVVTGFLFVEALTLYDGKLGNTASGHIWRWARAPGKRGRIRRVGLGLLIFVLLWHFLFQGWMPR